MLLQLLISTAFVTVFSMGEMYFKFQFETPGIYLDLVQGSGFSQIPETLKAIQGRQVFPQPCAELLLFPELILKIAEIQAQNQWGLRQETGRDCNPEPPLVNGKTSLSVSSACQPPFFYCKESLLPS